MSEKESWGRGGKGGVRLLQAESLRFGVAEGEGAKVELWVGQLLLVANNLLLIHKIQNVSFTIMCE